MANNAVELDRVFHALSNATRRQVVERLTHGPASMTVLAEPFDMALPTFLQPLQTLESAGIVRSEKSGRTRTYQLESQRLIEAEHWIDKHRAIWETRLNQLDDFLIQLKDNQS